MNDFEEKITEELHEEAAETAETAEAVEAKKAGSVPPGAGTAAPQEIAHRTVLLITSCILNKAVIPSQCVHWRGNPPDRRRLPRCLRPLTMTPPYFLYRPGTTGAVFFLL